jgi:Fe2+ or Zn2+ uptake regulation protein
MKNPTETPKDFALLLRESGHKATPGRLSLLQVLAKASRPLTIPEIAAAIEAAGGSLNQATLYRALEALLDVDIVRRVDMQHAHAHYELTASAQHHHHLICKSCGHIEDVERCDIHEIEHTVLKKSKFFASIQSHSLEFFGYCKKCAMNTNTKNK